MPQIIIDDKQVGFKQGQTIIEAAREAGISIPHFCWHPKLSVSGNCRICLVEVERVPKLVIACSTVAAEGMVVHTNSESVISAKNAVMEFLLINHPLDCPICDEAGECKLQDYAYKHGVGESRFVEKKVHKDKRVELGPRVMFDGERCISCSRCIRFCDEIAKAPELTFVQRGDRVTITTFPGKQMNNPYSMNTIDICPVGALTSRDFRFKARVWDMSSTKSICTGCSRGCNTEIWARDNKILRLTPRHNEEVNSYWMCDHGRLNTFNSVSDESRIDSPKLMVEGNQIAIGWDEAFVEAASKLKATTKDKIAVIGSAFATCEDNYLISVIAKSVLGSGNLDFITHNDEDFADDILKQSDITPNKMGAELAGVKPSANGLDLDGIINGIKNKKVKCLLVVEDDPLTAYPELEDALAELDSLIVISSGETKTTKLADVVFPASTYAEKNGIMLNFNGILQRLRPAIATIDADRALDGMSISRLDKFGTKFDRWASGKKYDARPSWKILTSLSNALGHKMKFKMAEDVFDEMSKKISELKNINYDDIGDRGVQIYSLETVNEKSI